MNCVIEPPDRETHLSLPGACHMELAFDTLASVKEALASAEQHQQTPLTILAFVDKWSPFAMRTAQDVETLRSSQDVRFARLFLLDMAQVRARAHWLAACPVVAAAGQRRAPNPARRGNRPPSRVHRRRKTPPGRPG